VHANRAALSAALRLPGRPHWLKQIHSKKIISVDGQAIHHPKADGCFTKATDQVLVIMTADCLPLLLTTRKGTIIAALHVGWKGLAAGIIEAGVAALFDHDHDLIAWMGPAIGPLHYEVGDEVRIAMITEDAQAVKAFQPSADGRWLMDLYQLTRQRLGRLGITAVYGGDYCTYTDRDRFFSYRRDGVTGRMATLIWRSENK
jgi:YfiH family protein